MTPARLGVGRVLGGAGPQVERVQVGRSPGRADPGTGVGLLVGQGPQASYAEVGRASGGDRASAGPHRQARALGEATASTPEHGRPDQPPLARLRPVARPDPTAPAPPTPGPSRPAPPQALAPPLATPRRPTAQAQRGCEPFGTWRWRSRGWCSVRRRLGRRAAWRRTATWVRGGGRLPSGRRQSCGGAPGWGAGTRPGVGPGLGGGGAGACEAPGVGGFGAEARPGAGLLRGRGLRG